jgi:hypothetical protein
MNDKPVWMPSSFVKKELYQEDWNLIAAVTFDAAQCLKAYGKKFIDKIPSLVEHACEREALKLEKLSAYLGSGDERL